MQNVYLFPYTWDEIRLIVELEDNRVWTFARLEENRNKNEPGPIVDDSQEDYKASVEARRHTLSQHDLIRFWYTASVKQTKLTVNGGFPPPSFRNAGSYPPSARLPRG
jgi:hypothetical protein